MKQVNAIIQSSDEPHILAGGLNSLDESDYSQEKMDRYCEGMHDTEVTPLLFCCFLVSLSITKVEIKIFVGSSTMKRWENQHQRLK